MKLPDFLIIGGAKCGTAALWYNLDKHPDVSMATKNDHNIELNFWGGKARPKGLKWYSSRFGTGLVGEKTPAYCSNAQSLIEAREHIPNAKLIYCVRNPVDRAYSNFQMKRKQMEKKNGVVPEFNYEVFMSRYASAGNYIDSIINRVLPNFDREQLYICIMEHMKSNSTEEMAKVFDFLGVSDLALEPKILKISPNGSSILSVYVDHPLHGKLLRNRTRQEDIKLNREENYYRVWSKYTEKLDGPLRQKIIDYYKPLNQKLYDFLGYTIKEWGK